MANEKNFLVGVADALLYYNDVLACTCKANLNSGIEASMQDQAINAGKGNKKLYSYKYGRELAITLEAADWKLEYIAANVGSKITEGLKDVYKVGECIQITNGIGILSKTPIGEVAVELNGDKIVMVTSEDKIIDLSKYGVNSESVKATYQYNTIAKSITIDADTSPKVFKLVLDAELHNNKLGKVGAIQVIVPSYQPEGNFTMNFTPDGVASTSINGSALAIEGDRCDDGSAVYAYIHEFYDNEDKILDVSEIAVSPATLELTSGMGASLEVIGLKGEMYSPIQLENTNCTFVSDDSTIAIVDENGLVTAVGPGPTFIDITYDNHYDTIDVIVDNVITPKLIDSNIMTVYKLSETVLGKSVSDLISDNVNVLASGTVTGTLKHVTGFTDFNNNNINEQSGYYFPLKLTQTGTKMTIKTNGEIRPDKTNMKFDPEILLRVANKDATFTIEVDGNEVVTLNFKKTTFL